MPIIELIGSRAGGNKDRILRYLVLETDDEVVVRGLVNAFAPATYANLVKSDIHTIQEGEEFWHGDVQYSTRKQGEPGDVDWGFEIGEGPMFHRTYSLETEAKYPAGARDFNQLINVRREGNDLVADGIDLPATCFKWHETHHFNFAAITPAYVATLETLQGSVNNAAWRTYAKGEVKFIDVTGQPEGEYTVPLTFRFQKISNRANFNIGDIAVAEARGWEYLWVYGETKEDAVAKAKVLQPEGVYRERVFEWGDFSQLGIPNAPWA